MAETDVAKQEIKEQAHKLGAIEVGIAAAADIDRFAPKGYRPGDLLTGARSVVVVSVTVNAGAWHSPSARAVAAVAYNPVAAPAIARQMCGWIEQRYGYYALPAPTGPRTGHMPFISLKLCAEMAGLGTRSLAAGIVLNQKYGLQYFAAAFTTMPLEADGPLADPVCPAPSCWRMWQKNRTTPCLTACPMCLKGELEGGRIKSLEYNQRRCYSRAQTTSSDVFQKLLAAIIEEPDVQRRRMLLFGSHFTRSVRSMAFSQEIAGGCFECLRPCPVGYDYRYKTLK